MDQQTDPNAAMASESGKPDAEHQAAQERPADEAQTQQSQPDLDKSESPAPDVPAMASPDAREPTEFAAGASDAQLEDSPEAELSWFLQQRPEPAADPEACLVDQAPALPVDQPERTTAYPDWPLAVHDAPTAGPMVAPEPNAIPIPTADPSARQVPAAMESAPVASAARTVTVYIDADNQLPNCAHALVRMLQDDLMLGPVRAIVAGNNCSGRLDNWCEELRWTASAPSLTIERVLVPPRKQAADVALIMAMGVNLADHIARRDLLVIVSRDESLIGAAEWAKAQGAGCLTAYGNGTPPASPDAPLPTLVLPVLERDDCPAQRRPTASPLSTAAGEGVPASRPAPSRPEAPAPADPDPQSGNAADVLDWLRARCKVSPKGGFPASSIGQELAKRGLNESERRAFLTDLTKRGLIRVTGQAQDKRYLF